MKKIALVMMLVAVAVSANAQLLWKVSAPGSEKVSYLFGTNHFAPLSVLDNLPVDEVIASVDELYGELSPEEMAKMSVSPEMAQAMIAPADSTLDKVFTPAELAEISERLEKEFDNPMIPMIIKQLNPMKPTVMDMMIIQLAVNKLMPGFDMSKQLDNSLLARGAAAGKPVKGLETIATQINAVFGTPISLQAQSLLKGLREPGGVLNGYKDLMDVYMAGNLDGLFDMTVKEMDATQRKTIIDDRNNAWIQFMLGMLPTTSIFIICGAGHLGGDSGLIRQLRDNGYIVEPAI